MLQLTDFLLNKLVCSICGNFLNCAPIGVNKDHEQVCGQCFPTEGDYYREIGLETVLESIIFPCKYNKLGCLYKFSFNNGLDHENLCTYGDQSLKSIEHHEKHNEIDVKAECSDCYNTIYGAEKFKVYIELKGSDQNQLRLTKLPLTDYEIELNLQLEIEMQFPPKVCKTSVTVKKKQKGEDTDSVSYALPNILCARCKQNISQMDMFYCPFGHKFCKMCKSENCSICDYFISRESHRLCKNFDKGCTKNFSTDEIQKHEVDCEFNNFKCLLCSFSNDLSNVTQHMIESHDVIQANELRVGLTKQDKSWYLFSYGKIFCCKYYNFEDYVEVLVSYFGSNDNATMFKYKLDVFSGSDIVISKTRPCMGWNDVCLEEAVSIDVRPKSSQNLTMEIHILENS